MPETLNVKASDRTAAPAAGPMTSQFELGAARFGGQSRLARSLVATLAGIAVGRAPGLRIDRAGIALVGASLMLAFGPLSFADALKAVDLDTIALLLGMMIIIAQLRVAGFFELAGGFALERARGPLTLLAAIVLVTGCLSAFLVNDAICLAMAPLVLDVTRRLRRDPVPYLLATAMASNAGSVATLTGNPQNMIIGVASRMPYARVRPRPRAARRSGARPDLRPHRALSLARVLDLASEKSMDGRARAGILGRSARRSSRPGVVVAFFAGAPVAEAAMIGGSLLLVTRAVKPKRIYAEIDGSLLLMFAGLFIVVAGAQKALSDAACFAAVGDATLPTLGSSPASRRLSPISSATCPPCSF